MNRVTLLLVVSTLATVLITPTGAFQPTGADQVTENVELAPAEGSSGAHAVVNENGEMAVVLSEENPFTEARGVNVDAVTVFDSVFTITNVGDQRVAVWLTDEVDDVRFFDGADSVTSVEGRENGVTLRPGERVHVGLRVDTRGDYDDVENMSGFTVHTRLSGQRGGGSDTSDTDLSDGPSTTPTAAPTPSPPTQSPTTNPASPSAQSPTATVAPETGTPATDETSRTSRRRADLGASVPPEVVLVTVPIAAIVALWRWRSSSSG